MTGRDDVALVADGPRLRGHWGTGRMPPPSKADRERESPPVNEAPGWARRTAPERDEAARALWPDEHAAADRFWTWLLEAYVRTRGRMWTGYRHLEARTEPDPVAEGLYRYLGDWLHWLEGAWWLLSQWYAPENRCKTLWLPLDGVYDGHGRALRIVREYRGLKGEALLEEALRLWRDQAVLTHHLPDVGRAPAEAPSEPEPVEPARSLKPPTQRTAGTATVGARRLDADLGKVAP